MLAALGIIYLTVIKLCKKELRNTERELDDFYKEFYANTIQYLNEILFLVVEDLQLFIFIFSNAF